MLWDYYGNEGAVTLLRSHLLNGSIRQAYLFSGPSGVGRRTLALRFAQAINCQTPPQPGQFCGTCRSCKLFETMRHPDLEIVVAEQRGGILRVEQIRELQHRLSLAPYEGRSRIALILRFEEANSNAQNALLKTLEEPPQRAIILLTSEDSESLLPTIVSRCELIRLRPLAPQTLTRILVEEKGAEASLASQIARLSTGRVGIALRMLQDPALRQYPLQMIQDHLATLKSSFLDRFALAERLAKATSKAEVIAQLEHWVAFWRDVNLFACGNPERMTYREFDDHIAAIVSQTTNTQRLQVLKLLHDTIEILQGNVNLRLALETLFLNLPLLSSVQMPAESAHESAGR